MQSSGKDVSYEIIPKEIEALKHAMGMAEEGTFITALSDVISMLLIWYRNIRQENYWKMIKIYRKTSGNSGGFIFISFQVFFMLCIFVR
jgi:hypothetical protein